MSMYRAMQNPDTPDLPFAQSTMELATLTRINNPIHTYIPKPQGWNRPSSKRNPDGTYTEEFLISTGKQRPLYEVGGICNCATCCAGGCCNPVMRCGCHVFDKKFKPYGVDVDSKKIDE